MILRSKRISTSRDCKARLLLKARRNIVHRVNGAFARRRLQRRRHIQLMTTWRGFDVQQIPSLEREEESFLENEA